MFKHARPIGKELLCDAVIINGQPRKDAIMPDLKLGKPIPTGIPGMEPVSTTAVESIVDTMAHPFERTIDSMTSTYPGKAVLDQMLLFPMKLCLSITLASTAMLVSPWLMVKQPETNAIPQ
ncbi:MULTISPECIES: hypothetical protein [unclassified Rhizobium]|uniref:hypothetical protein n=1 Tax=unclassified Rhizobium TaxID=2613769 RepID=UPI0007155600|nr:MULTISPECIES: hypothetical protein [unclassified Rhizobium]KQS96864.1 hypothetical protein ASG42_28705 [Rhizobium sp. Leaf391]KQT06789.1 hypothetical protein ASG50_13805 [Rhizobium sp. Leaf386]KQU05923.1 hypothetical protein ASG68_24490 [Rhizobium sp. Leaf453]